MFSLELTKEELNALIATLDSAIRYDGVKSVQAISHLLGKIQNATPVVPAETMPTDTKTQE
jgi:hypothetical protein